MKRKWLFLVLGIVVLLVGGFFLSGNLLVLRQVNELLKSQVRNQLGDGWTFDYDKGKLNLKRGELMLYDIELTRGDEDKEYWTLNVESIKLYGFSSTKFLSSGSLRLDSLAIDRPIFEGYALPPKDPASKPAPPPAEDGGIGGLKLQVKKIRTSNGSMTFNPEGPTEFSAGLDFLMTDLAINGIATEGIDMSKGQLILPDVYFQFPDSIYVVHIDSVEVLWGDTLFAGHGLHMESNLGKIAYGHHFGWKKARWDIQVPNWFMTRPEAVDSGLIHLSEFYLNEPYAEIFKDGRLPFPDDVKKYPQELVGAIPMDFHLNKAVVKNGHMVIEELHGERNEAARIELNNMNAVLKGLQNQDRREPALVMDGSIMLQGKAYTEVRAEYLYGANHPYTLKGTMEPTDLQIMREFLEHSGNLSVKSGQVNSLAFDLQGTKDTTFGDVDFRYSNLEVALVDKQTGEEKSGMINFFTNAFGGLVYHKNNPSDKFGLHIGEAGVVNKPYKAFVGHWIDGLLDGLIHSVLRTKTHKQDRTYRKKVKEDQKEERKSEKGAAETDQEEPEKKKRGLF